jgi:hypothetical protein
MIVQKDILTENEKKKHLVVKIDYEKNLKNQETDKE